MRRRQLGWAVLIVVLLLVAMMLTAASLLQSANINPASVVEALFGPSEAVAQLGRALTLLRVPLNLVMVGIAFLAAFIVSRLSNRLSGWFFKLADFSQAGDRSQKENDTQAVKYSARRLTSHQLLASLISFAAFTFASIFALGQFVSLTNLAILATVLANAFGFAARDYVGDILNGVSNLFEDRFDVGDNVEIVRVEDEVRGIVEKINIRTMGLRTRSGELVIVPQGQVRIIRNFSRGVFTGTDVTVSVAATDLLAAMQILVDLGAEAPALLTELIEPWRVISQEGKMNTVSELVIYAKAAYGRGAQLRLEIMALAQQRLAAAGIELAG